MKKILIFLLFSFFITNVSYSNIDIKHSLWRLKQDVYILFLNNECKFHLTRSSYQTPLTYDRELENIYNLYYRNGWEGTCKFENKGSYVDLKISHPGYGYPGNNKRESEKGHYLLFFESENKVIGAYGESGLKRLQKIKKKSYPPNIRGVKVKLAASFVAKLETDSKKIKTVKKPEDKKPKITKKPKPKSEEKTVVKEKPKEKIIVRPPEIDKSLITIGSGSGFYINKKGHALTNNHVIEICKQNIAIIDGREVLFRVIGTDKINDVGIIKTDYKPKNFIRINENGAKLGENIIAVGYPLAGRLSDSVKITKGIVSSLSGLNNNTGQIQIDAALQPGNSGGPVLNEKGELIGIASAGLNKLLMAKEAKYIPENVNFAVASPIVSNLLKNKKISYSSPSIFSSSYSSTDLAELGDQVTLQLFCRNTKEEYARLKKSKKYTQILLDIDVD